MARSNPVIEKSYAFALQVVAVVREMQKQREYVLSNQLLRAGTSIGANVEEAGAAQSRRELIRLLTAIVKSAQSPIKH